MLWWPLGGSRVHPHNEQSMDCTAAMQELRANSMQDLRGAKLQRRAALSYRATQRGSDSDVRDRPVRGPESGLLVFWQLCRPTLYSRVQYSNRTVLVPCCTLYSYLYEVLWLVWWRLRLTQRGSASAGGHGKGRKGKGSGGAQWWSNN